MALRVRRSSSLSSASMSFQSCRLAIVTPLGFLVASPRMISTSLANFRAVLMLSGPFSRTLNPMLSFRPPRNIMLIIRSCIFWTPIWTRLFATSTVAAPLSALAPVNVMTSFGFTRYASENASDTSLFCFESWELVHRVRAENFSAWAFKSSAFNCVQSSQSTPKSFKESNHESADCLRHMYNSSHFLGPLATSASASSQ